MSNRTQRSESGAALLEFTFVFPILVVLLLGMVTSGLALNHTNSLNNAAREGARFGATLPITGLGIWLDSVAAVAEDSATGDLIDGVDGRTICVAYVYPGGSAPTDQTTRLIINEAGLRSYSIGSGCYKDGRPNSERRVQVRVARNVDLNFVFAQPTVNIDGQSTSRFERTE